MACVAAVLAVPAKEAEAAFPGANGKLVFSYLVSYDSDPSGIFAVNPDGTERTDLTRAPFGYQDESPAVSPDGDRVVFQRYVASYGYTPDDDLYLVGMDGARKSFAYDPDTDRLTRTTGKLSYGRHFVRVVAEDSAGNATAQAWSFKVVRGR